MRYQTMSKMRYISHFVIILLSLVYCAGAQAVTLQEVEQADADLNSAIRALSEAGKNRVANPDNYENANVNFQVARSHLQMLNNIYTIQVLKELGFQGLAPQIQSMLHKFSSDGEIDAFEYFILLPYIEYIKQWFNFTISMYELQQHLTNISSQISQAVITLASVASVPTNIIGGKAVSMLPSAFDSLPTISQVKPKTSDLIYTGEDIVITAKLEGRIFRKIKYTKGFCDKSWRLCEGKITLTPEDEVAYKNNPATVKQAKAFYIIKKKNGSSYTYMENIYTQDLDVRSVEMEYNKKSGVWQGTIPWKILQRLGVEPGDGLNYAIVAHDDSGSFVSEDLFPGEEAYIQPTDWEARYSLPLVRWLCPFLGYGACYDMMGGVRGYSNYGFPENEIDAIGKKVDLIGLSAKADENGIGLKLGFAGQPYTQTGGPYYSLFTVLVKTEEPLNTEAAYPESFNIPSAYILNYSPHLVGLDPTSRRRLYSGSCLTAADSTFTFEGGTAEDDCTEKEDNIFCHLDGGNAVCSTGQDACTAAFDDYCDNQPPWIDKSECRSSGDSYCSDSENLTHDKNICDTDCLLLGEPGSSPDFKIEVQDNNMYMYVKRTGTGRNGEKFTIYESGEDAAPLSIMAVADIRGVGGIHISDAIGGLNYYHRAHELVFRPGVPPGPIVRGITCYDPSNYKYDATSVSCQTLPAPTGAATDSCMLIWDKAGTGASRFKVYRAETPDPSAALLLTAQNGITENSFVDANLPRNGKTHYYFVSSVSDECGETGGKYCGASGALDRKKWTMASCTTRYDSSGDLACEPCENAPCPVPSP